MKTNKKRNHRPWFDSRQGTKHGIVSQRPPIQTETAKLTKPTYKQFVYNLLGKSEYISEKKGNILDCVGDHTPSKIHHTKPEYTHSSHPEAARGDIILLCPHCRLSVQNMQTELIVPQIPAVGIPASLLRSAPPVPGTAAPNPTPIGIPLGEPLLRTAPQPAGHSCVRCPSPCRIQGRSLHIRCWEPPRRCPSPGHHILAPQLRYPSWPRLHIQGPRRILLLLPRPRQAQPVEQLQQGSASDGG